MPRFYYGEKEDWNAPVAKVFTERIVNDGRGAGQMAKLSGIELKRARLVPSSVFASPDEVVGSTELSRVQKIAILRRWEFDVRCTDSGGNGQGLMLHQVHQALGALGVAPPALRAPVVTH